MMKILIKKQGLLFCLLLIAGTLKAQEYYYDANGNLVQDSNKGLQSISYNHLNLVEKVIFKAGGAITYSYDAAGNKLSKTVTDPQGKSTTWYYADGFEYSNDKQLEFFATEEGRVTPQGEVYNYEYNLKDHLGNTRISFDKDPTSGKARIIQKDAYYPFGGIQPGNSFASGQQNRYLYNGKEFQEELGFFDYGARMQDPWLARWNGVDPLAEKYAAWSPYNYVMNNPLKYVDPDGREIWIAFDKQKVQYKNGKLYDNNGKEYQGDNKFALIVKNQLNQLSIYNDILKERLNELATGENIHTIQKQDEPWEGNKHAPTSEEKRDNGIPTGSIVKYDPDREYLKGEKVPTIVGLGHEVLGHSWDSDQGKTKMGETENGIRLREVNAVNVENLIRKKLGLPNKTTYGGLEIPKELLGADKIEKTLK